MNILFIIIVVILGIFLIGWLVKGFGEGLGFLLCGLALLANKIKALFSKGTKRTDGVREVIVTCKKCSSEFRATPRPEDNWLVTCPKCGMTLRADTSKRPRRKSALKTYLIALCVLVGILLLISFTFPPSDFIPSVAAILMFVGMFVAPVAAVVWIVSAVMHRKSDAKRVCLAAAATAVIGFVTFGVTYHPAEKPDESVAATAQSQVESGPEQAESSTVEAPAAVLSSEAEPEPDGVAPAAPEASVAPSAAPEGSVEPEPLQEPEPEPLQAPESSVESESEPDYNAMADELEALVMASVKEAVAGKFREDAEPWILYTSTNGYVLVKAEASDNFTIDYVVKGAWMDIRDTLAGIDLEGQQGFSEPWLDGDTIDCKGLETLCFNIMVPGSDIIFLKAEFSKEVIESTDWATVPTYRVQEYADDVSLLPEARIKW